jgi:hypothetical protein
MLVVLRFHSTCRLLFSLQCLRASQLHVFLHLQIERQSQGLTEATQTQLRVFNEYREKVLENLRKRKERFTANAHDGLSSVCVFVCLSALFLQRTHIYLLTCSRVS